MRKKGYVSKIILTGKKRNQLRVYISPLNKDTDHELISILQSRLKDKIISEFLEFYIHYK